MDDERLVAAAERGDAEAVTAALEAGADPDTVTDDGLPVLCLAVAAYDAAVAEALAEGGTDPDRRLPDGTTPLVRAVEGGSPAVVTAVLGREPRTRLPEAERERLLALARRWYERGAEEGLRDRVGGSGPVRRSSVRDDEYGSVPELTLGGLTVRDGHGAILTELEWAFRVLAPVDELVARAVARHDPEHVDRSAALWTLDKRRGRETWSAVTAHRHCPDPERRLFVLDVLRLHLLFISNWRNSYERETAELLVAWATEGESDPRVLAEVLRVLGEAEHRELEAVGLRHAGHSDPRVRARVPLLLFDGEGPAPGAAIRAALLALARDEDRDVRAGAARALAAAHGTGPGFTDAVVALLRDPAAEVRARAAEAVASGTDRTGAIADALAALRDEGEFETRLNAAYGLLRRHDPRADEAIERLGPLSRPGYEHDHRLSAIFRRKWEREDRSAAE